MDIKIISYNDEATDFQDKEIPKLDSNDTCLALISLYCAVNKDASYYPQVFLRECKYIEKVISVLLSREKVFLATLIKNNFFFKLNT